MPEPQTWNVDRTGDGRAISLNGKPIKYRITHQHFTDAQRLGIHAAIADVAPRVRCGYDALPTNGKKPMNGKAVHDLNDGANLYVYAKYFDQIDGANPSSLAFVDTHTVGDQILAAVMVFNPAQFGWIDWAAICHHEAGHVVGLKHPLDSDQLMGFDLGHLPWKAGDLDGFAALRAAH